MIPKKIHYIWLGGGEMPKIFNKCYKSWVKYCPDYEIIRWDESNLNLEKYKFVKDALLAKKWAFASDVLRTEILYNEGGIYLDVDVELLKPIDNFLDNQCFGGFETSNLLNPGLLWGTEAKNEDLKEILNIYENIKFDAENCKKMTICEIYTAYYEKQGLVRENKNQSIGINTFFCNDYFSPIDVTTNKKRLTKNTYSIHWYNASWYTPKQKFLNSLKKVLNAITFGLAGKIIKAVKNGK